MIIPMKILERLERQKPITSGILENFVSREDH